MINTEFKERLEEILDWARFEQEWIATEVKDHDPKTEHEKTCGVCVKMRVLNEQATQSLITLFEDYTKAIVGEEENGYELGVISGEKYARRLRNLFRQTINQTSKTILRGTE